ncbi:nitrilase-related carbon-nitrogen hydrolase [Arsenophonus nasoniae]|uniref:Nitrilase-related carbon-nitrogen hydrolase n=1 Tax=Arsenophonus nasoniae TaxID=638 RepID=A0AA95GR57_9GAMM|nr:nitrilase-related carbon-nitrogen hydrolase [Arsenophonus nasoniae]WGM03388.1 nitrilase-related carbon-nitrogen hydrolase [Arsenophonus nasoniae]
MKIALAQIDTVLGNKRKNLLKIENLCSKAAKENVDIICFPELSTTGYSPELLGSNLWNLSESFGGKTDTLLSELSNSLKLTIICGFIERGKISGEVFNSAGIWIPHKKHFLGTFQKIHLINNERIWFTQGMHIPLFDTPKCRVGIMICHDVGFPELARIIALKGADIIFLPSAWHKEAKDIWTINCASRALENGIHLAAVNRCGKEENLHFFGGSQLIDARGQTLKLANYNSEELIFCEVDFNEQLKTRLEIPYLRHRRTDIYSIEYTDKNEY